MRLIPAGAGNTARSRPAMTGSTAHPRGCGEHTLTPLAAEASRGSSPRVRGTPGRDQEHHLVQRLIPAGAGNTLRPLPYAGPPPAHPRGCGEHLGQSDQGGPTPGSSPRVRGTLRLIRADLYDVRLIPAGAGNTATSPPPPRPRPAHPRGCGEHSARGVASPAHHGSSPRVRGTRSAAPFGPGGSRLIPAGAGNTRSGRCPRTWAPAHPRGCGEH